MTQLKTVLAHERITESDLAWWLTKIPTLDWVFAVTYAEGAPHEYVVGGRTHGLSEGDCERAARVIRTFGEPAKFFKKTRTYLVDASGWKYWDMAGDDPAQSGLINRARAEHVYGVQNAPRTQNHAFTPYDMVATYWDAEHSTTGEERDTIKALVNELTGGYGKSRTLDVGCGTGLTLDLGITESVRYVGIDPAQAMLNELVRKYPYLAGVHALTFTEAIERRVLGGTKFDLVLALGGSASYLNAADLAAIPENTTGHILLSVYAESETPVTGDLNKAQLEAARAAVRAFAVKHDGRIEHAGRFDIALVGAR